MRARRKQRKRGMEGGKQKEKKKGKEKEKKKSPGVCILHLHLHHFLITITKSTHLPSQVPTTTTLHNATPLPIHLPILIYTRHHFIIPLLHPHLLRKPPLQKPGQLLIQIIAIRHGHRLLSTQRTPILLLVLHHDEAPDAEGVMAGERHGPPLYVHAHGAEVVFYEGDVRQDGCGEGGVEGGG